jgi:hypothetical protein
MGAQATGAAAPVVTIAELSEPTQNGHLEHQNVRINNVQTVARAGNQAFWVSGAYGNRVLVVESQNGSALPQSDQPNNEAAAKEQVRPGEIVSIVGTVERINSGNQLQQQYGVQQQDASRLQQGDYYLVAQQIYPQVQNQNQNHNQQQQNQTPLLPNQSNGSQTQNQ